MGKEKRKGVKIVSDGTVNGTKVFIGDAYIQGVTKIEIMPIKAREMVVTATITINRVRLQMALDDADITCTDTMAAHVIKKALLVGNKGEGTT